MLLNFPIVGLIEASLLFHTKYDVKCLKAVLTTSVVQL